MRRAVSIHPAAAIQDRSGLGLGDELNSIADRQDRIGGIVGDFHAEFFFESHHEFDSVERICTQIIDKAGTFGDLVGFNAQMVDHNFLYAFCDIAHVGFLDLRLIIRAFWRRYPDNAAPPEKSKNGSSV
jgi:hypothetical protein